MDDEDQDFQDGDDDFVGDDYAESKKRATGRVVKKVVPQSSDVKPAKPKIDPADKKRGRPSKEIVWDDEYTGPLRRCAYVGHEELWGDDVPVDLQPQYYYNTTARCIYCYKYLCNQRHANKVKARAPQGEGGAAKPRATGGKKRAASRTKRGRRNDDDDDEEDDGDNYGESDEPTTRSERTAQARKSASTLRGRQDKQGMAPMQNPIHTGEVAYRAWLEGPRILRSWKECAFSMADADLIEGKSLDLRFNDIQGSSPLAPGSSVMQGGQSLFINATQSLPCVGVAWISSDVLVIGGGASLQLWAGLSQMGQMTVTTQPRLLYTLELHAGKFSSFCVLPRAGVPGLRHGAVAAVHDDGRVRIHSLPITPVSERAKVLKQQSPSPASARSASAVVSVAVSTNPQHANRIILGHKDGSLRWIDLPDTPEVDLPPPQGSGGAGFPIATAGYLPTSDAAFWAVGDSSSVAIGDVREPFGGGNAPPQSSDGSQSSEFNLRTADSSGAFPALVAGGDGGHVWALPWASDSQTPPPRLLCSLNGAALSIRCHLFLPLALTGCASGTARALWLPNNTVVNQQLIVHAASAEERFINIDAPFDLLDTGFRSAGPLACVSCAWAPDMEGRYAVAHAGGLIRVGNTREFVLRSTALKG